MDVVIKMKYVNKDVCLGQQVSLNPSIEEVIKRRIWQAFGLAGSIFKSNISMVLKTALWIKMQTCVRDIIKVINKSK